MESAGEGAQRLEEGGLGWAKCVCQESVQVLTPGL